MTGPDAPTSPGPRPGGASSGGRVPGGPGLDPALASTGAGPFWRAVLPEIIIAAFAVAATAAAGYAVAGRGALAVVAVAAGVISLLVLRSLVRPLALTSPGHPPRTGTNRRLASAWQQPAEPAVISS